MRLIFSRNKNHRHRKRGHLFMRQGRYRSFPPPLIEPTVSPKFGNPKRIFYNFLTFPHQKMPPPAQEEEKIEQGYYIIPMTELEKTNFAK